MPAALPKTLLHFLIALLKHQAKQWLGEEVSGIAAQTLIDQELQTRLHAWLGKDETARRLLQAAENARLWLQDPHNCPDEALRQLFHSLDFGTLPAVQQALADLPQAMDTAALTEALRADFERTLPNLTPQQHQRGAQLWSEALLRALLPLRDYTLPVVAQISLTILAEQHREFADLQHKVDEIINRLAQGGALELAARYLQKHPRLGISAYLGQLARALDHPSMQNWKPERKSLTAHDLSMLQTFALSWEQVKETAAQRLFLAAGYCAPNLPLPLELFALDEAMSAEACEENLQTLLDLSLLKPGPAIHPLLAQFARRLDADGKTLQAFSEHLADLAEQTNHEVERSGNYRLYAPFLPHVREAAGYAESLGLPAARRLWNSLGYHLQAVADYAATRAAFERALRIDEAAYGRDHLNVARCARKSCCRYGSAAGQLIELSHNF